MLRAAWLRLGCRGFAATVAEVLRAALSRVCMGVAAEAGLRGVAAQASWGR